MPTRESDRPQAVEYQKQKYDAHRAEGYSWACAKGSHKSCGERAAKTCTCPHHNAVRELAGPRPHVEALEPGCFLYARSWDDLTKLGWLVRDGAGDPIGLSMVVDGFALVVSFVDAPEDATAARCPDWNA